MSRNILGWALRGITVGAVAVLSFIIASHYRNLNKLHSGGDKKLGYYFKKIWINIILIFGMSTAISVAGGLVGNGILGGIRLGMESGFMQGAVLKIPLFLIYLAVICNMFFRQGHHDADRRVFNAHLKMLIIALAVISMMPGAVYNSIHDTHTIDSFWANLQSAFSPNVDVYLVEDNFFEGINNNYSMILTGFTLLLSAGVQVAVAVFAYARGKHIFLKKRLNPGEYETDERCG